MAKKRTQSKERYLVAWKPGTFSGGRDPFYDRVTYERYATEGICAASPHDALTLREARWLLSSFQPDNRQQAGIYKLVPVRKSRGKKRD